MEYNSKLTKLKIREYGRTIQKMVEHCMGIEDREKRQICANTIFQIMMNNSGADKRSEDQKAKVWNMIAEISGYELDIDYPFEIVRKSDIGNPQKMQYPQKKIKKRNYGIYIEKFADVIKEMEDEDASEKLGLRIANHMKRDLSNWSIDSMSDSKVTNDLAEYTDGKIAIDSESTRLTSDGELLSTRVSTSLKKKRKK